MNKHKSIPLIAVESSQITHIGHEPMSNTLAIQFKNKDGSPGSVYHYENVTAKDFEEFKSAKSIGSHFGKHIKPHATKFPYKKVA